MKNPLRPLSGISLIYGALLVVLAVSILMGIRDVLFQRPDLTILFPLMASIAIGLLGARAILTGIFQFLPVKYQAVDRRPSTVRAPGGSARGARQILNAQHPGAGQSHGPITDILFKVFPSLEEFVPPYRTLLLVAFSATGLLVSLLIIRFLLMVLINSAPNAPNYFGIISWMSMAFAVWIALFWLSLGMTGRADRATLRIDGYFRLFFVVLVLVVIAGGASGFLGVPIYPPPISFPWLGAGAAMTGVFLALMVLIAWGRQRISSHAVTRSTAKVGLMTSHHPRDVMMAVERFVRMQGISSFLDRKDAETVSDRMNGNFGTISGAALVEYGDRIVGRRRGPLLTFSALAAVILGHVACGIAAIMLAAAAGAPFAVATFETGLFIAMLFSYGSLLIFAGSLPFGEIWHSSYIAEVKLDGTYKAQIAVSQPGSPVMDSYAHQQQGIAAQIQASLRLAHISAVSFVQSDIHIPWFEAAYRDDEELQFLVRYLEDQCAERTAPIVTARPRLLPPEPALPEPARSDHRE